MAKPKSNNIFQCSHCDFRTTTKGGLTRHVNVKHNGLIPESMRAGRGTQRINPIKTPKTKPNKKSNKVKPKKQGARKLDPLKAYKFYFDDNTRSYADVAKEFGVATQTIANIAKVEYDEVINGKKTKSWRTWAEHRQVLIEEQQKKRDAEYRKTAPVRSEQHLLQYRNLQVAVSQKIAVLAREGRVLVDATTGERIKVGEFQARELADVAKALKLAIDGERVIMGLPTSVSTIKPGADDDTGKGWGELLAHALKAANEQPNA